MDSSPYSDSTISRTRAGASGSTGGYATLGRTDCRGLPEPILSMPGSSRGADPQRELQFEAALARVHPVAEQLPELGDAIADGLRVDVELLRDGRRVALMGQPGAQRSR